LDKVKFDLPRGAVVPVKSVDVVLDPAPHPFETANAEAIEANWRLEYAANPRLFDGTMVLLSELRLTAEGHLAGRCHAVRFATMLYWRKNKGSQDIEHCYAHAALVSADDALVAIRMGRHTANPGRVYFAAGSFEPGDFVNGHVDAHGNMRREVMEETGLDIAPARQDAHYHLYSLNGSTVLFKRYWLDDEADALAAGISAFVAAETDPEIEGPVIIRRSEPLPEGTLQHMAAIVRWHFDGRDEGSFVP
jgi:8-oxo-dGTP pyrophosphatase MutT (NUDIX family)